MATEDVQEVSEKLDELQGAVLLHADLHSTERQLVLLLVISWHRLRRVHSPCATVQHIVVKMAVQLHATAQLLCLSFVRS